MAAIADDIAYNSHDLDDGLRAGPAQRSTIWPTCRWRGVSWHEVPPRRARRRSARIYEVNRRMITAMIEDAVRESRAAPGGAGRTKPRRRARGRASRWSPFCRVEAEAEGLKDYLYANVYRHPRVMGVMRDAEAIVARPVRPLHGRPAEMPGLLGRRRRARRAPAAPRWWPTSLPA